MRSKTVLQILTALCVLTIGPAAVAQVRDNPALMAPADARDSSWNVILNGRAVHLDAAKRWNEKNWGLGLEREFDTAARWVKVAVANGFRDSLGEPSYMVGGGLKRRFRPRSEAAYVDFGVVGFLMTRNDVDHNRPFPGVLPVLTVGMQHVAVNLTYLPQTAVNSVTNANKVDPTMNGILFIQLKLDLGLFGIGRNRRPLFASAATEKPVAPTKRL